MWHVCRTGNPYVYPISYFGPNERIPWRLLQWDTRRHGSEINIQMWPFFLVEKCYNGISIDVILLICPKSKAKLIPFCEFINKIYPQKLNHSPINLVN